jgi:hypothetical protein
LISKSYCTIMCLLLRNPRCLKISRNLGDKGDFAAALGHLGHVVWCAGDDAEARALYEESVAIFRELDDRQIL